MLKTERELFCDAMFDVMLLDLYLLEYRRGT